METKAQSGLGCGPAADGSSTFERRPWGCWAILDQGDGYKVKRIEVNPGGRLSLQWHRHRSEHWIVVAGTARVTIDGGVRQMHVQQSTFVPAGTLHRIENPGRSPLVIIEVQNGRYLGEDDIVRVEDDYDRIKPMGSLPPSKGAAE